VSWRTATAGVLGGLVGVVFGAGLTWETLRDWPPTPAISSVQERAIAQRWLRSMVRTNVAIDHTLNRLVADTPAIAFVRLATVVPAPTDRNELLFSTVAQAVAVGHRTMLPPLVDQPAAVLTDFLPELAELPPHCLRKTADDLQSATAAARMRALGAEVTLVCGVFSPSSATPRIFLGLLFTNFDHASELPTDLSGIERRLLSVADELGRLLVATNLDRARGDSDNE
jgi:hypothetical protein